MRLGRYEIGLFQKKRSEGGAEGDGGVEDMGFPGVLKKKKVHFPEVNQKL